MRYGREAPPPGRATGVEMHLAALEQTAPPSVLIDDRGNVVHLSPTAARFFQQSGGPPTRRVTDLVRPELRDDLHALINRAMEGPEPRLSAFLPVAFDDASHQVAMLVQQRPAVEGPREQLLITFLDAGPAPSDAAWHHQEPSSELVRDLREKLRQAEQRIGTMRDEHFSINEDLRAANEELQTVNNELKLKLDEVSRAHSDLENLMAAADVATLFLDRELRIKRFTPKLGEIFNVKVRDYGRPIGDLTHSLEYDSLEQDAGRVLANRVSIERETRSRNGQIFVARLSPYRLAGGRDVDGVVITFVDVTEIKIAEAALRESESRQAAELETLRSLHRMAIAVAGATNTQEALDQILESAIELHHADFGNVQVLEPATERLEIVAQRGFRPDFLVQFRSVGVEDPSSCGRALLTCATVQIPDIAEDAAFAPYRDTAIRAGYRAVQSTPLISRGGALIGVLSVHFGEPHAFSDRDRQLGGLLGQWAADLIDSRVHWGTPAQKHQSPEAQTATGTPARPETGAGQV